MSVALAVFFLLGNAYFVGAQFALITTRRDQVEPLARAGVRGAQSALNHLRSLPRMLAGSQLGIAACSLGLGAVAEPAFAHGLEHAVGRASLPHGVVTGASFVLALVFVSFCHMVLGEMVPKNLALAGPVRAALLLSPPMSVWVGLTRPILVVINGVADLAVRALGQEPKSELGGSYTADELADLFDESHAEGFLDDEERDRLRAAARLDRVTFAELTIPLDRTVTITEQTTVDQLERLAATSGLLRFPVQSGDTLTGYVHAKDLVMISEDAAGDVVPRELIRPLPVLAAGDHVTTLLRGGGERDRPLFQVLDGNRLLGIMAFDDILRAVTAADGPPASA